MSQRKIAIALPKLGKEELALVEEPINSGWLTQGPKVAEFEKQFAALHHVEHAAAVTSCTAGLHLALLALGVGEGDEVIVPAFSWVASANAVIYCGATPVLTDVDKHTYNIDPKSIAEKVTPKTKAIIAVHLFGLCADIDAIYQAIPPHVAVVEDAACAAGASYKGKFAGGLGNVAAFSFHPRKIITTGEGGMVTTQNSELAEHINMLRNHGATVSEEQRHHGPKPYILPDFNLIGYNYRMTDLQGAIGLGQLAKLQEFVAQRQKFADVYMQRLAAIAWLDLPRVDNSFGHSWQSFVISINPENAPAKRNELMEQLQQKGISTRPGTHAIHTLNAYVERYNYKASDFPNALHCQNQTMAIPLHNNMDIDDIEYICDTLESLDTL